MIPVPEPDLTPDQMVARAHALLPALRARQAETEMGGNLPQASLQDFLAAGFYRTVQPRRFGGYEFDMPTFSRVMMEVARGCPASGWVLALTSGHTLMMATFAEQAQRDAYGRDGDLRAPSIGAPGGSATRADGGWKLSGWWDYASGIDVATHFIGSTRLLDDQGKLIEQVMVLVPAGRWRTEENWNTIGMQGTGSKRIVIEDVFVPDHHIAPRTRDVPGRGTHANPMYCKPLASFLIGELAAVAIGTARGAVDLYEQLLLGKRNHFPPFEGLHETREHQLYYGRAHALVATAEAAMLDVGRQYMAFAREDDEGIAPFDDKRDRHLILIEQQAVELAWQAMDLLFKYSGTSGAKPDSPLGRHFRDLAVIRTHITVRGDRTAENYARMHFGLPPLSPL